MFAYDRPMKGKGRADGFTLIELVIMIVVLGIIAAVAIPRYYDVSRRAQESTVRAFGAALKEAESTYLSRVVLEGASRTPPVQRFSDFVALTDGASARNTIAINNSIRQLLQNPSAEILSGNGTTITLNLKGGASAVYQINPATGTITESYTGF